TAFNARPWQASMPVVAGTPAALQLRPLTIADDELDGRHGDGNGSADAGETIDLTVPLGNAGGTAASDVAGTLSTGAPFVSVLAPSATYGSIDPGATAPPSAAYRVQISFGCPDQREVPFTLDVLDADLHHSQQTFRLLVHAPELAHISHDE